MGQSDQRLTTFGQRVAALQDRAPEAQLDRARGQARFVAAPAMTRAALRPLPPRRLAVRLAAALAALLALAFGVVVVIRPRAPLRFDTGTAEPGIAGAWIAAPPLDARPIRFSDGSLLRLAPGGRARVTAVDADGAEIALEQGALEVSVVHRDRARWKVSVGPFQVQVIGTRFDVRWDPAAERFEVALHEGVITLSGPVVGEARPVRAGEKLTISAGERLLHLGSIDSAVAPPSSAPAAPVAPSLPPVASPAAPSTAPPPRASASEAAPVPATAAVESPAPAGPPASATAAPAGHDGEDTRAPGPAAHGARDAERPGPAGHDGAEGWKALALNARYKEALAAAEREGFDAVCASASAPDLQALGYAARLGGSPARAVQALTALRKRFPGSSEAGAAAFMMGRIAQDQSKDPAGAAAWFARYLSEQPWGAFAAEALGRLVETTDKAGDEAGARKAATRYLTAYPSGPHADYARALLARGARAADTGAAPASPSPSP